MHDSDVSEWRDWAHKVFSDLDRLNESSERILDKMSELERRFQVKVDEMNKDFVKLEVKSAKLGAVSGVLVAIGVELVVAIFTKRFG